MPFDGRATEARPAAAKFSLLSLLVRMPDGGVLAPPAAVGARLIDALAGFGIPIREEPRGGCAKASARIKQPWADRLPAPDPEERTLLAASEAQDGTSRLLSRIVLTPDLDGLEIELPWESLVPQTYWVAG